jgi:predicted DNA-binding transcriptional regulator AlpA
MTGAKSRSAPRLGFTETLPRPLLKNFSTGALNNRACTIGAHWSFFNDCIMFECKFYQRGANACITGLRWCPLRKRMVIRNCILCSSSFCLMVHGMHHVACNTAREDIDECARPMESRERSFKLKQPREKLMHLQDETLLNRKQVSQTLGLSPATIDRLRKTANFPKPLQISARRVAWSASSIREYLRSCEHAH